jgi:hypothetical protein
MYKKFGLFMFLSILVDLILITVVFADGQKSLTSQIRSSPRGDSKLEREPVTWDNVINGSWGDVTPGLKDPKVSPVFNDHGAVLGEEYIFIESNDLWQFDSLKSLEPDMGDEFGSVNLDAEGMEKGIVIGIKYFFKRFQIDRFRRSILSVISNSNKTAPGKAPAVAFYIDVP